MKPRECIGCPLYERGSGFAPAVGSRSSALCFVGEALGRTEAARSEPFVGEAGVYLNRAFRRLGLPREQQRIGNVIQCQPPNDWLRGASWEQAAIAHCNVHRVQQISGHKVYVTLGVTATETMLRELLGITYSGKLENWHGYVLGDEQRGFVIPTFHPAFLLRGNQNLFGTVLFDITRAMEVGSYGYQQDTVSTIEDPNPTVFADYVRQIPDDPGSWLAVDIETPGKIGANEDDLVASAIGLALSKIIRIAFAFHPDQGCSVPCEPRYYPMIREALAKQCAKIFHNERYDAPILESENFPISGVILDSMWAWHMLQSDVKKGLGFIAPFYSKLPPWKHLSSDRPAYYNCMDVIQDLRIMLAIARDLQKENRWETFLRYSVQMDRDVLHPMEGVGIHMDKERLRSLEKDIETSMRQIIEELGAIYPDEIKPREGRWKKKPLKDSPYHEIAYPLLVDEEVIVCTECKAVDVGPKHKCKKEGS